MHRFEAILKSPRGAANPWDRAVAESESFVAFPSLGSMVPGWLLVVPRRPILSMRELTSGERDELVTFYSGLVDRLSDFAGEAFLFEHGNTTVGGPVGCGVDQAHIHVVPLSFDLIEAAASTLDRNIQWTAVERAAKFVDVIPPSGEYVSIWRPSDGRGLSGELLEPRSQWVRRVIAAHLGREGSWDYKANPEVQNLLLTLKTLQSA